MKYLLLAVIILSGCASNPPVASFADIQAKYNDLKEEVPERVIFDFDPACNDDGMCMVEERKLNEAADIITLQNDAVLQAITGANTRLDSLAHCEYSGLHDKAAITALEQAGSRQALTSSIRELALGGICGVLLLGK